MFHDPMIAPADRVDETMPDWLEGAEGLDEDWEDPRLDCDGVDASAEDEPELRPYRGGPLEPGVHYAAPNGAIMIREAHRPPLVYPPGD